MRVYKNISKEFKVADGIKVIKAFPQPAMPLHIHDFNELTLITGGKGTHCTEDGEYRISQGDVFFIRSGSAHGYKETKDLHLINLVFFPEKLAMPLADIRNIPGYHAFFELEPDMRVQGTLKSKLTLASDEMHFIMPKIAELDIIMRSRQDGFIFIGTSYLMQIIYFLSKKYTESPRLESADPLRIGNVLSYIEKNYSRKISLDKMASMANMSRSSLLRAFLKMSGYPPVEYLLRLRMKKASELLHKTALPVSEIAGRCGFPDNNYFARQFKKMNGISPLQFRKNVSVSPQDNPLCK